VGPDTDFNPIDALPGVTKLASSLATAYAHQTSGFSAKPLIAFYDFCGGVLDRIGGPLAGGFNAYQAYIESSGSTPQRLERAAWVGAGAWVGANVGARVGEVVGGGFGAAAGGAACGPACAVAGKALGSVFGKAAGATVGAWIGAAAGNYLANSRQEVRSYFDEGTKFIGWARSLCC
jgi:hypothetical protein